MKERISFLWIAGALSGFAIAAMVGIGMYAIAAGLFTYVLVLLTTEIIEVIGGEEEEDEQTTK